jgi:spore coat polysaccharide biosynthesis protein SpsF
MVTACIQVCTGSTRLPGKVLLPIAGHRVAGPVARRCRASRTVDEVVFAIADGDPDEALVTWCERRGHDYVVGPEDDLLERHRLAAEATDTRTVVRVTGDCPFVPPSEIDRTVERHLEAGNPYASNMTDRTPDGVGLGVLQSSLLTELSDPGATHPVLPLREDPATWGTVVTESEEWSALEAAHTAVDTPTDYWTLVDATEAVGLGPGT